MTEEYKIVSSEELSFTRNFLTWLKIENLNDDSKFVKSFGFLLDGEAFSRTIKRISATEGAKAADKYCRKLKNVTYNVRAFNRSDIMGDKLFVGIFRKKTEKVDGEIILAAGFPAGVFNTDDCELMAALCEGFNKGVLSQIVINDRKKREKTQESTADEALNQSIAAAFKNYFSKN